MITGIPLHLWTIGNLKNIGKRLGHIDTVELSAGRMLIDVDTRKPLTFKRKIASPEGDEVWIQIHYEKLFKYCKTYRMVTHEVALCPTKETPLAIQGARSDVFSRVQLPANGVSRQSLPRDKEIENRYGRDGYGRRDHRSRSPLRERRADGGFMNDARAANSRRDGAGDRKAWGQGGKESKLTSEHTHQSSRYAPYGKHKRTTWRMKERSTSRKVHNEERIVSRAGTHIQSTGESSVHQPTVETIHDIVLERIYSLVGGGLQVKL